MLAVLVALGVGHLVDDGGGQEAFEQANGGDCQRSRKDDLQCFEIERNVGKQEDRKRRWQGPEIGHRACIDPKDKGERGQDQDADQW